MCGMFGDNLSSQYSIEALVNKTLSDLKLSPKNEGVLGLQVRGPDYLDFLRRPAGEQARLFTPGEIESLLRQAMDREGLNPTGWTFLTKIYFNFAFIFFYFQTA